MKDRVLEVAEVSDGLIVLAGYTYGSYGGDYTGDKDTQAAAVMLRINSSTTVPTLALSGEEAHDSSTVWTIAGVLVAAALLALMAVIVWLRKRRVNARRVGKKWTVGNAPRAVPEPASRPRHNATSVGRIGTVTKYRDSRKEILRDHPKKAIGGSGGKSIREARGFTSVGSSVEGGAEVGQSEWELPVPEPSTFKVMASEGAHPEKQGSAEDWRGPSPGCAREDSPRELRPSSSEGVTSSIIRTSSSLRNSDMCPNSPVPTVPRSAPMISSRGQGGGHDGSLGSRCAQGLGVIQAVLGAAQELAQHTSVPGIGEAASLLSVLLQLVSDHEGNYSASEWRVRWCRSILGLLEQAEELLGEVRDRRLPRMRAERAPAIIADLGAFGLYSIQLSFWFHSTRTNLGPVYHYGESFRGAFSRPRW